MGPIGASFQGSCPGNRAAGAGFEQMFRWPFRILVAGPTDYSSTNSFAMFNVMIAPGANSFVSLVATPRITRAPANLFLGWQIAIQFYSMFVGPRPDGPTSRIGLIQSGPTWLDGLAHPWVSFQVDPPIRLSTPTTGPLVSLLKSSYHFYHSYHLPRNNSGG